MEPLTTIGEVQSYLLKMVSFLWLLFLLITMGGMALFFLFAPCFLQPFLFPFGFESVTSNGDVYPLHPKIQ